MRAQPKQSQFIDSASDWNGQWRKWFAQYSQGNPRLGKWLYSKYPIHNFSTLEIGAGSGRESRFISAFAPSVTCADFSPEAVSLLASSKLPANMRVFQADASALPFPEKSFDLTFHKGVWVLFPDDSKLKQLLREQLRVTRKIALSIVQNALNLNQVQEAKTKSASDSLFRIRFFTPNELIKIAESVIADSNLSASIKIKKYGSPALSRYLGRFGPCGDWFASRLYAYLPWRKVECVVLEIELL